MGRGAYDIVVDPSKETGPSCHQQGENMRKTLPGMSLLMIGLLFTFTKLADGAAIRSPREEVTEIVSQIRRADYEGDRTALKKSYDGLAPFLENKELASRVRYWRGFALWRSAINGSNDSTETNALEQEFRQAVDEFKEAVAKDPGFVDAKVGMISCLGYIAYFHRKESDRVPELLGQIYPLVKEAREAAPDNPRLIWVLGPILWYTPADRGGGLDKVIANYERGLELCSKTKTPDDSLEPSWGKPELMMSLAYSYLQKNPPDVNAAERNARSALELVPYWHYLRDILLPQIVTAKTKNT
jgi:hypothetical protein